VTIAIFGLGYVGSVSAACLAAAGHRIVGVDVDGHKLDLIRRGHAPVKEPGLDELLGQMVAAGQITVTSDTAEGLGEAEVSLICVGTPSRRNGSLDSSALERVLESIGQALAARTDYHVVAIRSTLLPGVLFGRLLPLLERASGRRIGVDIGVCVNPEFLREGSAIRDFEKPPFTVVGETDRRAGEALLRVYSHVDAPVHRLLPDEASMLKYACNNFHALKVAFANEIGALCQPLGIDGQRVMRVFCEDRELNISPRYLRPGFAFGGSCLPKDLRAIAYVAKERDVAAPLLTSVAASNDAQVQRVVDLVTERGRQSVALLGLSFKVGSDDLRESPFVRLAEALIGKGVPLRICDPDVALGNVFGRNKAYVDERLPHVAQLFGGTLAEMVAGSDVVVIGKKIPGLAEVLPLLRPDQTVIDLVGIPGIPGALQPWSGVVSHPDFAAASEPALG
jgi:GDP-mannose 6-dehydrogenase